VRHQLGRGHAARPWQIAETIDEALVRCRFLGTTSFLA
jgi:hypothetical protein